MKAGFIIVSHEILLVFKSSTEVSTKKIISHLLSYAERQKLALGGESNLRQSGDGIVHVLTALIDVLTLNNIAKQ